MTATPTTWGRVVSSAVIGFVLGWGLGQIIEERRGELLRPPWSTAVVLAVVAVALVNVAVRTRARRRGAAGTKPLPPLVAARLAALGLAAVVAGALLAGGYLGYAVDAATDLATTYRKDVFLRSVVTAIAAACVAFGGWLLERGLRSTPPPRAGEEADRAPDLDAG